MYRTVTNLDAQNSGDPLSNQFDIKRRGRCRVEIKYRLLRSVGFCDALITMQYAQQLVTQSLFHKGGNVTADLPAVIALIHHEVVTGFAVQYLTGKAVIFNVGKQGERSGICEQRD